MTTGCHLNAGLGGGGLRPPTQVNLEGTINGPASNGNQVLFAFAPFDAAYDLTVTIDPTGRFAFVANTGSDNVSPYAIDATSGALSPIRGSPFVTGTQPSAIDPTEPAPHGIDWDVEAHLTVVAIAAKNATTDGNKKTNSPP